VWEGKEVAPRARHLAPQLLASSPLPSLSGPGVPTPTPRAVRFPQLGLGPTDEGPSATDSSSTGSKLANRYTSKRMSAAGEPCGIPASTLCTDPFCPSIANLTEPLFTNSPTQRTRSCCTSSRTSLEAMAAVHMVNGGRSPPAEQQYAIMRIHSSARAASRRSAVEYGAKKAS